MAAQDDWAGIEDESGSFEVDEPSTRPQPPFKPPPGSFMAVKQEVRETAHQNDEERQAKIRAMVDRMRAEAKKAQADSELEQSQQLRKRKASDMQKNRQNEQEDMKKVESLLEAMEEKAVAIEEELEKVAILAAPLSMEAVEEFRELQLSAIHDTEKAVKAALVVAAKAQKELELRKLEAESLCPAAKARAIEELEKISKRIEEAIAQLDSHKSVRKDYEAAISAEKAYGGFAHRLASVEIDCEKAAMMAEPLAKALDTSPDEISFADVRETKEALRLAQASLAPTIRLIANKVAGLKGPARQRLLELTQRAEAAQATLEKAQRTVEESQSRAAAVPILRQVVDRAVVVEEVLQMMRETEAPFLMGIETMPADEAAETLSRMDKAAALAQSALADAHKYVALKGVEVARLSEGTAETARRELDRVKLQIDEGFERVRKFQADSAKRRRLHMVEGIKQKVEEAESAIIRLREAGASLQSSKTQNLLKTLETAHAVEHEAQNAVTIARRELQEKQQDIRPLQASPAEAQKSNSDLLRTKVRVNYMETELAKFRKLAQDLEERMKVEKSLSEISSSLQEVEQGVGVISAAAQHWTQRPNAEEEGVMAELQGKLTAMNIKVESKLQTAEGIELKELRNVFGRLQKSQTALNSAKEAAKEQSRSISRNILKEVSDIVQKAESKVSAVYGPSSKPTSLTVQRLEALTTEAKSAMELIAEAKRHLAKGQGPQLLMDAKVELARLQLRVKTVERKGKEAAESLISHYDKVASEAEQAAVENLRSAARQADGSLLPGALFKQLSGGAMEVSEKQLVDFFERSGMEPQLSSGQVRLALNRMAPHGFTKQAFSNTLANFMRVSKDMTMTDEFPIQSAKKVRKVEVGELIEAQGSSQLDKALGLVRLPIRALSDGATGWVTMKSSAGIIYLSPTAKPFLWCARATTLRQGPSESSDQVSSLRAGEVLELLEGPREDKLGSDLRVRGITCQDETPGWLQVSDNKGNVLAKICNNIFKCVEAIAMTNVPDFANCAMVRRIDAGEALEIMRDVEEVHPSEGGSRRKFRACKDGSEGWVTVKGSQGTVYVKVAQKHYLCQEATPIHTGLSAESAVTKVLLPGEAFSAFEDPKEVAGGETMTMFRVKGLVGQREGWVFSSALQEVQPWTPRYFVLKAVPLTQTFAANEAADVIEVIRMLQPSELVGILEQPLEDTSTGQLRARCVALRDKAVGWVTVQDNDGDISLQLRPATASEEASVLAESTREQTVEVEQEEVAEFADEAAWEEAETNAKKPRTQVKQEVKEEPAWGKYGTWSSSAPPLVPPAAKRYKGGGKRW